MELTKWKQLLYCWTQYKIRKDRINETRIDKLIEELKPTNQWKMYQKKYERRYTSEEDRQKKYEEAKQKPSEYWNYTTLHERIYINWDKRKQKYYVQYISDIDYNRRNERTYCESLQQAIEKWNEIISMEVILIY